MTLTERVTELNHLVETGRTVEAMERLYADEVVMQENHEIPRIGKAACIAHEQRNLAKVQAVAAKLLNQAINVERQTVFSEWRFVFTDLQNQQFLLEEVSVQQWQNGQVVCERFYYHQIVKVA